MPSRNRLKNYTENGYYHVYNRGINKRVIFNDDEDHRVFLNLFKRYLDVVPHKDLKGREYFWLRPEMSLLAYCLMPNHFHLLVLQKSRTAITRFLRGVCTSYTGYFNQKYKRTGHLFQDVFKASHITQDSYLQHISRYIHLNPKDYQAWQYSSLQNYLGTKKTAWLNPSPILDLFENGSYKKFVDDYKDHKKMLDEIKYELANYTVSKARPWKR